MLLNKAGLRAESSGIAIRVPNITPEQLKKAIESLLSADSVDALELARTVKNKISEKFHPWLTNELLDCEYCSAKLDIAGALNVLSRLMIT